MRYRGLLVLALTGMLFNGACNLPANRGIKLGVPHRQQISFNYCVPASVLMWRLYDGLPEIHQDTIYNWLGGSACTADRVPSAVNYFTRTRDTYADIEFWPGEQDYEGILARQITSIDSRVPVIAIVGSKNHVGVINGGGYHEHEGQKVWDFVYFHDPAGPWGDDYYSASAWLDFFCRSGHNHCAQIISSSATIGWKDNLSIYGSNVEVYGDPQPFLPAP